MYQCICLMCGWLAFQQLCCRTLRTLPYWSRTESPRLFQRPALGLSLILAPSVGSPGVRVPCAFVWGDTSLEEARRALERGEQSAEQ